MDELPLSPSPSYSSNSVPRSLPSLPSSSSLSSLASEIFSSSTSGVFCDDSTSHEFSVSDIDPLSSRDSLTSDSGSEYYIVEIAGIPEVEESLPSSASVHSPNVSRLEQELLDTQKSFLSLSTELTRLKFKLRQVISADPAQRLNMLEQLRPLVFSVDEEPAEAVPAEGEPAQAEAEPAHADEAVDEAVNERHESRQQQFGLIRQLREQWSNLASVSHQQFQLPSHLVEEHNNIRAAKEQLLKRINERLLAKDKAAAQAVDADDDDSD